MIRHLAYYGNPILRKKGQPIKTIDSSIYQLVEDMYDTMDANNGCGLAAPQIHVSLLIFVTSIPHYDEEKDQQIPGERRVFINPKILQHSQEEYACSEGCLSIPGLTAVITRPMKVTIEAMDLTGKIFTEEFIGFDAHVIMHENDHINGVLYIDRLTPKVKKDISNKLKEIKKKYSSK